MCVGLFSSKCIFQLMMSLRICQNKRKLIFLSVFIDLEGFGEALGIFPSPTDSIMQNVYPTIVWVFCLVSSI